LTRSIKVMPWKRSPTSGHSKPTESSKQADGSYPADFRIPALSVTLFFSLRRGSGLILSLYEDDGRAEVGVGMHGTNVKEGELEMAKLIRGT